MKDWRCEDVGKRLVSSLPTAGVQVAIERVQGARGTAGLRNLNHSHFFL